MLENAAIADLLDEVADLLELKKSDSFRIRAYRNASRSVRTLGVRLADLIERGSDLKQIPGIGATIADEIRQMQSTGTTERREKLREGVPPGLLELLRLPGIGPRKAWDLWTKAQVGSIADLRAAVESKRIRELPGMGEKTEDSLRKALENVAPEAPARLFFKDARAHLEAIGRHLDGIDAILRWEAAGSYRRKRETIGDLDVLIETKDGPRTAEGILAYAGIKDVLGQGAGGVRVKLADGLQVDFRFVEAAAFGAAQMYFTGSKAHNIELRQRAIRRGFKLNEYGLHDESDRRVAGKTEQAVYKKLGLPWIAPELREPRRPSARSCSCRRTRWCGRGGRRANHRARSTPAARRGPRRRSRLRLHAARARSRAVRASCRRPARSCRRRAGRSRRGDHTR